MLLAIDVGNTQTCLGVFAGMRLLCEWRVSTEQSWTADECMVRIKQLFAASDNVDVILENINRAAIACVVPALTNVWVEALHDLFLVHAVVCSAETAGSLFVADFPNVAEVGADRVADAVAASALYGAPIIIADFGTATNIEAVNKQGSYVGGIIAPGLEISAQALFAKARKLSDVPFEAPAHIIGKNTEEAVKSGLLYGEAARVDGLVRYMWEEMGYKSPVVTTGGLCRKVSPLMSTVTYVNQQLTLHGIRLIADYAQANAESQHAQAQEVQVEAENAQVEFEGAQAEFGDVLAQTEAEYDQTQAESSNEDSLRFASSSSSSLSSLSSSCSCSCSSQRSAGAGLF